MKSKVLFVCVENSCRSQMAESFARKLGDSVLEAWSAGSKPSGKVNEMAIQLMREKGVDLSAYRSKGLSDLPQGPWDYVIAMGCGDACPFVPTQRKLDWDLPDPKNLPVDDFRRVRDEIESRVRHFIESVASPSG